MRRILSPRGLRNVAHFVRNCGRSVQHLPRPFANARTSLCPQLPVQRSELDGSGSSVGGQRRETEIQSGKAATQVKRRGERHETHQTHENLGTHHGIRGMTRNRDVRPLLSGKAPDVRKGVAELVLVNTIRGASIELERQRNLQAGKWIRETMSFRGAR